MSLVTSTILSALPGATPTAEIDNATNKGIIRTALGAMENTNTAVNAAIATDPAATRAAITLETAATSGSIHPNATASMSALAEHLRLSRSAGIAIAGDSTGSGSATVGNSTSWRWPRWLAQNIAEAYPTHGVRFHQITADAGKAWVTTEIQASPNGETREYWLPAVAGIPEWQTATEYVAGSFVKITGSPTTYWFCVTTHTSTVSPSNYSFPSTGTPQWRQIVNNVSLTASGESAPYIHDSAATADKTLTTKPVEIVVDFVMPGGMTAQRGLWAKRQSVDSNGILQVAMWQTKQPVLFWWDGSSKISATANALPVADGVRLRLRIRFNPDNGSNRTIEFSYATHDGSEWSAYTVHQTVTSTQTSWLVPGGAIQLGGLFGSMSAHDGIVMYGSSVRRGITNNDPLDFDLPIDCYSAYGTKDRAMLGSPVIDIWSASWSGSNISQFLGDSFIIGSTSFNIQTDFPQPGNVLVAFVNFGHNGNGDIMPPGKNAAIFYDRISDALQVRFPHASIIGMTQNPGTGGTNNNSLDYARFEAHKNLKHAFEQKAALKRGDGWFDTNRVFRLHPDQAALSASQDGLHPNATGSALWGSTLFRLLQNT